MICRHCQKVNANRSRGLCGQCYYQPTIRDQYAPLLVGLNKHWRNTGDASHHPLPEPTRALPGTEAKLCVLEARAAANQLLFHPLDATAD